MLCKICLVITQLSRQVDFGPLYGYLYYLLIYGGLFAVSEQEPTPAFFLFLIMKPGEAMCVLHISTNFSDTIYTAYLEISKPCLWKSDSDAYVASHLRPFIYQWRRPTCGPL